MTSSFECVQLRSVCFQYTRQTCQNGKEVDPFLGGTVQRTQQVIFVSDSHRNLKLRVMLNLIFSLEPLCGVRFAHEWHDPSMRSKHVLFLLHSNPGLLIGFSSLYFMGLLFFCCHGYLAAGNNEYKTTLVNKTPLMSIIMMGHEFKLKMTKRRHVII